MAAHIKVFFERHDSDDVVVTVDSDCEISFGNCTLWPREIKLVHAIAKIMAEEEKDIG